MTLSLKATLASDQFSTYSTPSHCCTSAVPMPSHSLSRLFRRPSQRRLRDRFPRVIPRIGRWAIDTSNAHGVELTVLGFFPAVSRCGQRVWAVPRWVHMVPLFPHPIWTCKTNDLGIAHGMRKLAAHENTSHGAHAAETPSHAGADLLDSAKLAHCSCSILMWIFWENGN